MTFKPTIGATPEQPAQSGQLAIDEAGAAHNHEEAANGMATMLPVETVTAPTETHNARRAQETARGRLRSFGKPFPFPFKATRVPLPAFAGEVGPANQTPVSLSETALLDASVPLAFPTNPSAAPLRPFIDGDVGEVMPVYLFETDHHEDNEPLPFPIKAFPSPFPKVAAETAAVNQTPVCSQISAALGVLAKALVKVQRAFDERALAFPANAKGKGGAA